jgi:hypothetical protein
VTRAATTATASTKAARTMTDLAGPLESPLARAGTDAAADSRQARVEALQRRRAAGTTMVRTEPMPIPLSARPVDADRPVRTSRAGAARGSKIAAAGLGVTAMLGLVAAMGFVSTTSASTPPAPVETVPPVQVVVVVHPADGTADSTAVADLPGVVAATPAPPIVLSAQPTVRQAPASQAPAAKTNGSR